MKQMVLILALTIVFDLTSLRVSQAAPDVNNQMGATNITAGRARLQGTLVGGGPADVVVYWGPGDGGTNRENWRHKSEVKDVQNGAAFSITAENLIYGQTYFYRCFASNAGGEAWSSATSRFTTLKPLNPNTGTNERPVLTVKNGLVCWYDAAVGVSTDDRGVVQSWKDLSGHEHHGTRTAGSPVLAENQLNSKPAVQFRTLNGACGFNLDGPFFVEQQYVVVRSPNAAWNNDGCFLGRRWKRSSSYRLSRNTTAFWGDQYPVTVSKNGKPVRGQPFNLGPITEYMILKIDVNDGDISKNTYQIGMGDLASCDCDIAEILGFQTSLSQTDEELVGSYLAAKYGIATPYPDSAGMTSAASLTNASISDQSSTLDPSTVSLNTTLTCPGAMYDVRVYWGTTDGGTDASLWEHSAPVGTFTNTISTKLSHTITGLTPGMRYYVTVRGINVVDSIWADKSLAFRPGVASVESPVPKLIVRKGLACWFDAAAGVSADEKGVIQTWNDLSGNEHHASIGGGSAPVVVANQINSRPAVQFRKGWLALAGTVFAKEHYVVIRSPGPKWNGAGGLLGRLKGRGSSYNTWGQDTGFWTDVSPAAISRNGTVLPGPAFDCSPLTQFMILRIVVNGANAMEASYTIGNNDGLASCDFDVAEILGYESILSPADQALVGRYMATKYGIDTAYPPLPKALSEIAPGETASLKYKTWRHSGSLFLLTTPDGANLPASAVEENFPVLVRLNKDWFNFSEARSRGEDLRFTTSNGVPLSYQIDHWDAEAGMASIWVRVPIIRGNSHQEIKIYWGQAEALSESNGPAVFNKSNGYLSVWHMNEPASDDAGLVPASDKGSTPASGMIGLSRHFADGKGISGGEKITFFPFASSPHTSEAWFKADRFNTTILSWGKLDGVALRVSTTPAQIQVESGRKRYLATSILPKSEWNHVALTYDGQSEQIYVNGRLDLPTATQSTLEVMTPVRMQIGERFIGDLDEVRISKVARTADWIKLQYENQKPLQTLVGPLVQTGADFSVSEKRLPLIEGQSATVSAKAGGAQKVYWIIKQGVSENVVALDRFTYTLQSGRVTGDQSFVLQWKAVYADGVKTFDIPVTIQEEIPDPVYRVQSPADWDGRQTIEVVTQISNLSEMQAKQASELTYQWTVPDLVEAREITPGKLTLKRSRNSGTLNVSVAVSNGGKPVTQQIRIKVTEPKTDPWVQRIPDKDEKPEENQFFARDDKNEGTLYYNGSLDKPADAAFLKVYADDKLFKSQTQPVAVDKKYAFTMKLKPGLVKYRVEFGTTNGAVETLLQTVGNLVCGDAYLINGQSNALATDTGEQSPAETSEWIRSYGRPEGDDKGPHVNLWCHPVWKAQKGEKAELGWWGMELAKRLVESQKMPIFVVNGAVGGTRIDQHQRNEADPTDLKTIYGRMLWRVRQAKLTHGIRAVLWHQGEADQGADGPTDGYGSDTYQRYFLEMQAVWKNDFPNVRHYYLFQIWPNACSQGGGHGDMLREVQRTLPRLYSNMDIISTLGIQPPGGCHYPLVGWSEFARLVQPLIERDFYGRKVNEAITPPNLQRVTFTNGARDEIRLEFDQPVNWDHSLASQFYLDESKNNVVSGVVDGNALHLQLKTPSMATKITYLKEMNWSQDKLLKGANGIAALTFCDVSIAP
ncbi:MAG: DUF2341 domain-containing protein [Planctomycetota bacterium]